MEKLIELLRDIDPEIDYDREDRLIDDGLIDSLSLLELVSGIEDTFGVTVTPKDLIPANFNSAASIWKMICALQAGG